MRGLLMTTFKNNEYFKIGDEEEVTVSVTFTRPKGSHDAVAVRNAQAALKFFEGSGENMSWVKRIEVKP
jgi:hypothetical protein